MNRLRRALLLSLFPDVAHRARVESLIDLLRTVRIYANATPGGYELMQDPEANIVGCWASFKSEADRRAFYDAVRTLLGAPELR